MHLSVLMNILQYAELVHCLVNFKECSLVSGKVVKLPRIMGQAGRARDRLRRRRGNHRPTDSDRTGNFEKTL